MLLDFFFCAPAFDLGFQAIQTAFTIRCQVASGRSHFVLKTANHAECIFLCCMHFLNRSAPIRSWSAYGQFRPATLVFVVRIIAPPRGSRRNSATTFEMRPQGMVICIIGNLTARLELLRHFLNWAVSGCNDLHPVSRFYSYSMFEVRLSPVLTLLRCSFCDCRRSCTLTLIHWEAWDAMIQRCFRSNKSAVPTVSPGRL